MIPPSPLGATGSVDVAVLTSDAGSSTLPGAFFYQGPPQPQALAGGSWTPTGAGAFTLTGVDFGPPGSSTVEVIFETPSQMLGQVIAQVAPDGRTITGNYPIIAGPPPAAPIQLTVRNNDGLTGVLGSAVPAVDYAAPSILGIAFQSSTGASKPVRLNDGSALVCAAGANGAWGDPDDEVFLLTSLPQSPTVTPLRRTGGLPVGFLAAGASRPTVLDADTACLFSPGADGVPLTPDDVVVVLDALLTAPAIANVPYPHLLAVPPVRVADNRAAFLGANPPPIGDGLAGTADDELYVVELSGTAVTAAGSIRPGAVGSLSRPVAPDSGTAFLISLGADGVPGSGDDMLVRVNIPSGLSLTSASLPAPFPLHRPIAASSNEAVVPTGGLDGAAGTPDDTLELYDFGAGPSVVSKRVSGIDPLALDVAAPLGTRGVVLPTLGPDVAALTGDESLAVFVDVTDATPSSVSMTGRAVLLDVGGSVVAYGPGLDFGPGGAADEVRVIGSGGATGAFQAAPFWPQALLPTASGDRAFAVAPGPDLTFGTGDEEVIVHSLLGLGNVQDTSVLPVSAGAPAGVVSAGFPFVPVGPSCGLVQSPGPDLTFGTIDDVLALVRF
jgi:hypothetical protein